MLNRRILTELASLEARFEAWCVASIDLIDSYDNVVCLIPGRRNIYKRQHSHNRKIIFLLYCRQKSFLRSLSDGQGCTSAERATDGKALCLGASGACGGFALKNFCRLLQMMTDN